MQIKGISLRGLEVFEALARSGSVAQAAVDTGLSQPAVSQQMRNLETALSTTLVDHSRRPMRLTPAGRGFLRHASAALAELRIATAEVSVMDLAHLSDLSLGVIDDFDDDLTPRLALMLADSLAGCRFRLTSASSTDLVRMVSEDELHMVIAASSHETHEKLVEYPLARDPFILVTPNERDETPDVLLNAVSDLPFLRYTQDQLISRQIESYLRREATQLPARFEIGSHLALMSMVAHGTGWTITTPLGFMRAARFHDKLTAHPLPGGGDARQISLFTSTEWSGEVPGDITKTMRNLMERRMVNPALDLMPWLEGKFHIL
ncbi:LysR family transcriptional regulator [Sulfitobacter donghicola]|uniref:LysR family transcriptional regulator n=1 Tax=Sulfitobacter donghicola DSW-25 = KCTC 12864 = JCM 14565 TaxID=1300350 RepID=A0A073IWP1_9RHOB|nr:LysR family transcriptional regulator [Sulfitobacter donghicola]KEJ89802.1 LysR family transcriptional regulator [Sulfitobacter donghicola DSW-25 = KCTC 12864 = JCM 14565]KIN67092.1 Transcriptional regulator, LysR family protein [Sulfitobacter donghicola DSW-25 = KCTC 12864 = JCM 14565]